MNNKLFWVLGAGALLLCLAQCRPYTPVPKPKGYFRVEMPEKAYTKFNDPAFPFSFEYPVYSRITQDTNLIREEGNPYWINVYVPAFDATIYLSYKAINPREPLDKLVSESFNLSYAHNVKADYIKEPEISTPKGYKGIFYSVGGDAASAYQFFITDEQRNFVRGSLYFNVAPNADSLAPMYTFLKKDLDRMIETFEFR